MKINNILNQVSFHPLTYIFSFSTILKMAQAPSLFAISVNPISTRGSTLSPPSTMCPPRFSDLATALAQLCMKNEKTFTIVLSRDYCPILPTILRIWKTWLLPKAKKFDYHMLLYFLKKIYCCPPFKKKVVCER